MCHCGVEIGGEPRAVVVERVHLCGEIGAAEVGFTTPLRCRVERIEGKRQSPSGCVDRARVGHHPTHPWASVRFRSSQNTSPHIPMRTSETKDTSNSVLPSALNPKFAIRLPT